MRGSQSSARGNGPVRVAVAGCVAASSAALLPQANTESLFGLAGCLMIVNADGR